jgi:hypothetical protein
MNRDDSPEKNGKINVLFHLVAISTTTTTTQQPDENYVPAMTATKPATTPPGAIAPLD